MKNRVMEGKRIVFLTAFLCNCFAFACFFTGFSSPYWFQSWPRVYSGFKRIGLWEACFAGLVLERDPTQKAYHGCWWILAPEYQNIRGWLMPWWFIITQVCTTLCIMIQVINLILQVYIFLVISQRDVTGGPKRVNITVVQISTIFTLISAIVMPLVCLLFGVMAYEDKFWMPRPDLNYLSWSYGLVVVSAFFSIFSTFAIVSFNRIVRQEYREPSSLRAPLAFTATFDTTKDTSFH